MALRRYSDEIEQYIDEAAATHKLDRNFLASVMEQESRGRQDAVSPKGALGVMQLMPKTAAELGVDPNDLRQNIEGGAKYLRQNLDRFGGSKPLALAAYNAGPDAVRRANGIPNYPETQKYVSEVLGRLDGTTGPAQEVDLASTFDISPLELPPAMSPAVQATLAQREQDYRLKEWAAQEAEKMPPDQRAKVFQYSLETGLDPGVVSQNLEAVEAQYGRPGTNIRQVLDAHPMLSRYIEENPTQAGLILADRNMFAGAEEFVTNTWNLGAYWDASHYSAERSRLIFKRDVMKITTQAENDRIGELDKLIQESSMKAEGAKGGGALKRGAQMLSGFAGGMWASAEEWGPEMGWAAAGVGLVAAAAAPAVGVGGAILAGLGAAGSAASSMFGVGAAIDMGMQTAGNLHEELRNEGVSEDVARPYVLAWGGVATGLGLFGMKAAGVAGQSLATPLLERAIVRAALTRPAAEAAVHLVGQTAVGAGAFSIQSGGLALGTTVTKLKLRFDLDSTPDSSQSSIENWRRAYYETRWGVDPNTGRTYMSMIHEGGEEGLLLGAMLAFPHAAWHSGTVYRQARSVKNMAATVTAAQEAATESPVAAAYSGATTDPVSHFQDQIREQQANTTGSPREPDGSGYLIPAGSVAAIMDRNKLTLTHLDQIMPDVARQMRDAGQNSQVEISVSLPNMQEHFFHMMGFSELVQQDMRTPTTMTARQSAAFDKFYQEHLTKAPDDPSRKVYEDMYTKQIENGMSEKEAYNNATVKLAMMEGRAKDLGIPVDEYYRSHIEVLEREGLSNAKRNLFVQRAIDYSMHEDVNVRAEAFKRAAQEVFGDRDIPAYRVVHPSDVPGSFAPVKADLVSAQEEPVAPALKNYDAARKWVESREKVTIHDLRSELKISKSDATKLLVQLENDGVLGPSTYEGRRVLRKEVSAPAAPTTSPEAASSGSGVESRYANASVASLEERLKFEYADLEKAKKDPNADPGYVNLIERQIETFKSMIERAKAKETPGATTTPPEAKPVPSAPGRPGDPTEHTPTSSTFAIPKGEYHLDLGSAMREALKDDKSEILIVHAKGDEILTAGPGKITLGDMPHDRVIKGPSRQLFESWTGMLDAPVVRGSEFTNSLKNWINVMLFKEADLYTYIHESSHVWFDLLLRDATAGDMKAARSLIDSMKALDMKGKITDIENHERFAYTFERYLAEGKAPSPDLIPVFRDYQAWALRLYGSLDKMAIPGLTPEAREFFDRLLVADQVARAKERQLHLVPMIDPKEAVKMGLDPAKANRLHELWTQFPAALRESMGQRFIKIAISERKAMGAEIAKGIRENDGLYNLLNWLETGEAPDAQFEGIPNKITPESLKDYKLSAEAMARLQAHISADGIPLEEMAVLFDFSSGKNMLERILATTDADRYLGQRVREELSTRSPGYGLDPEWMDREAIKVMYESKEFKDALQIEFEYLAGKFESNREMKGVPIFAKLESMAQQEVQSMNYLMSDPAKFRVAAGRARAEAHSANFKGDSARAYTAKVQEIYNHFLMKAALDARETWEAGRNLAAKYTKLTYRQKLGKIGDGSYLAAMEAVLDGVGFLRISNSALQRAEALKSFLDLQGQAGKAVPGIPDAYLDPTKPMKNYKLMTLSEMQTFITALSSIANRANLEGKIEIAGKILSFTNETERLGKHLETNLGRMDPKTKKDVWGSDVMKWLRSWSSALRKMEFVFRVADGGQTAGPAHEAFFQRISEAQGRMQTIEAGQHARFTESYRQYFQSGLKSLFFNAEDKARLSTTYEFGGFEFSFTDVMTMACVAGDAGTLRHLVEGRANILRDHSDPAKQAMAAWWTKENVVTKIDEILEKKDWATVTNIVAEFKELEPEVKRIHLKASGSPLAKIEKNPIATRHGDILPGWYFPLDVDRSYGYISDVGKYEKMGAKGKRAEAATEASVNGPIQFTNDFAFQNVGHDFTITRNPNARAQVVNLDFAAIPRLMHRVTHYVTHYEAVNDTWRLLSSVPVKTAIEKGMGTEIFSLMRPWLEDIANDGKYNEYFDRAAGAIRRLRTGASVLMLNGKMVTGIQQWEGIFPSIKEIGPKYFMEGAKRYFSDLASLHPFRDAEAATTEIKFLKTNYDRDYGDYTRAVEDRWMHNATRIRDSVVPWGMSVFWAIQKSVNVMTYWGAEAKAIAEGHKNPRAYAESVMRMSQSAGGQKDLPAYMRGPEYKKAWQVMQGYWSTMFNQIFEPMPKDNTYKQKAFAASSRMVWMLLMPVVSGWLLKHAFSSADPNDPFGDKPLLDSGGDIARELSLYTARAFPTGTSTVMSLAIEQMFEGKSKPVRPIPWMDIALKGGKATGRAIRSTFDEGTTLTRKDWEALGKVCGTVAHVPAQGIINTWDYLDRFDRMQEPVRNMFFRSPSEYR